MTYLAEALIYLAIGLLAGVLVVRLVWPKPDRRRR
jgi:hypothetical protein